ncbi:MAG: hypothetical protein KAJ33_01705 [Thermoplasmata archaeon]|nr:hypothetical protein [Thermoplasmata archaeon]
MAKVCWYSPEIIKKAFPALIVILAVFISIMFLAEYTDAFFIVIILWITLPVLGIQIYRKIKARF